MSEMTIQCPQCHHTLSLSGALTAEIRESYLKQYKEAVAKREQEMAVLKKVLEEERASVEAEKITFEQKVEERLHREKSVLEQNIKARLASENQLALVDLKNQLQEKQSQVEEAQKIELDLRKKARVLEEKEQNMEIHLQRQLDEQKVQIQMETTKRIQDELRLKAAEKDKQLEDMRRQIEDLKRKAEQGSQQTQGEVLELEIEEMLRALFPNDKIEPVPKGCKGGDIIHRVMTLSGQAAGTIIIETKRTKNWSDAWIEKLKDDQRAIAAECAVIITQVMPKECASTITCIDGVWVVDFGTFKGLALLLRNQLIELFHARAIVAGKGEKLDFLYDYLTGTQFKQRIETIVGSFQSMQVDLEREKRALQKSWALREQQINRVLSSTAGLYGDIQGIVGHSLGTIAYLELADPAEVQID